MASVPIPHAMIITFTYTFVSFLIRYNRYLILCLPQLKDFLSTYIKICRIPLLEFNTAKSVLLTLFNNVEMLTCIIMYIDFQSKLSAGVPGTVLTRSQLFMSQQDKANRYSDIHFGRAALHQELNDNSNK